MSTNVGLNNEYILTPNNIYPIQIQHFYDYNSKHIHVYIFHYNQTLNLKNTILVF